MFSINIFIHKSAIVYLSPLKQTRSILHNREARPVQEFYVGKLRTSKIVQA
jgi:hypothetical protein